MKKSDRDEKGEDYECIRRNRILDRLPVVDDSSVYRGLCGQSY